MCKPYGLHIFSFLEVFMEKKNKMETMHMQKLVINMS